jgi:tryptophan-rich sensory protein
MVSIARTSSGGRGLALAAFLATVAAVAVAGSLVTDTGPGSWYAALVKPSWQPPGWAFGPVWTALYVAIAVAGWLWWREGPDGSTALGWWWTQLALNLAWSFAFFGLQRPIVALATIGLLDLAIAACIAVGWHVRRAGAVLLVPYLAWTAFATALNAAIVVAN